ncbi:MAG: hypothetical protein KQH83_12575 [Actinobacteria bacterium]|nr:hypothetical protein [Actinomycetota bacterium]
MICPHGHPVEQGRSYCTVCGAPVGAAAPVAAPAAATSGPVIAAWIAGILIVAAGVGVGVWWLRSSTDPVPTVTLGAPETVAPVPAPSSTTTVPVQASTTGPAITSTTSAPQEATTSTTAAAAVWGAAAALDPGSVGSVARGIVESGVGLVAVGSDPSSGVARAAVWVSPDGTAWSRVDETADFGAASGGAWMHDATLYRDGILAVGAADDGQGRDVAVWTSEDATTWTRVPLPLAAAGGNQTADAVTLTPDGVVAVGWADWPDGSGGLECLWTYSFDGVEWQTALVGGPGDQAMLDVAWVDGVLVAVGFDQDVEDGTFDAAGGGYEGAFWLSTDPAEAWIRVRPEFLSDDQVERIDGVAAFGDLAVLVGGEVGPLDDMDVAVWVWSPTDGIRPVPQEAFAVPGAQYLDTVAVVDGRLVALGRHLRGDGGYDLIGWASDDGVTWVAMSSGSLRGADEKVVAVAGAGSVAVAVGAVDGAAAFWTAAP